MPSADGPVTQPPLDPKLAPKLVVVDGPEKGRSFTLDGESFTVGRQDGSDLQLLDAAVSRRHCEVRPGASGWELHDAGSAHGTFVNGIPVGRQLLTHGDYLQISRSVLLFLDVGEGDSDEPASRLAAASTVEWRPEGPGGTRKRTSLRGFGAAHGLVGESAAMDELLDFIARVGPVDSTVLLRGESGTGKELAAQALHRVSPRAEGPFVAINCASLSDSLLESELFGHERGAFTGAVERKTGKIEAASGGTLFLDEVGEMPATVQARLLRVLQERRFERVGGTRPIEADIRLVAATNRDLEAALRDGEFRDDLFYRLNVIACELPPLRKRRQDIPLLARHFAARHGERLHRTGVGLEPSALKALSAYDWPGNIRQLSNTVERALVLGDGEMIRLEDLPDEMLDADDSAIELSDYQGVLVATKKRLLTTALAEADGNAAEAARRLGLHPNSFRRLLRQLGLRDDQGSTDDMDD